MDTNEANKTFWQAMKKSWIVDSLHNFSTDDLKEITDKSLAEMTSRAHKPDNSEA